MRIAMLAILFLLMVNCIVAQDYDPSKETVSNPIVLREGLPYALPNYFQKGQEWRGLWVDAWNKGIASLNEVREVVKIAKQYGYNAILLQVRRRGDAIYFPSYPNTEPRIASLPSNLDTLQAYLQEAHAEGIEVHAWITTFLISTSTPPTSPQHVWNAHPEYLMENAQGSKLMAEGYYLDPGHPGALAWNEQVVMDLVTHYPIDGLHFDYIRYPQANAGYNPTAIARYNAEYGLTGKPSFDDPQFADWRRRQITDWLRYMYAKIISVSPKVKVTAATFAGRSDAYHNRFQDWATWMYEGMLDANVAMNYSKDLGTFQARCQDIMQYSYGRHVYMGIGAYLLKAEDTITQLQYARKSLCPGMILFSYAANCSTGNWLSTYENIYQNCFYTPAQVPDMPWKINLKHGHIIGTVNVKDEGLRLYNASIVVPMSRKIIKSDSMGRFSLLGIPQGEYDVLCQAPGFKVAQQKINVIGGKVEVHDFFLERGETSPIILDNEDAQRTGNWSLGVSAPEKYGKDYLYIGKTNTSANAFFAFPSSLHGQYRIYAWYSAGTNRTKAAEYTISHANGSASVTLNQQQNGGKWNLLGTWDFSWPNQYGIRILESKEDGKVVIVDAIKLEKVE